MSRTKRSVSATFAVFLNTFLIISTVIVFAVLIFLSYRNTVDTAVTRNSMMTDNACWDVAVDLSDFIRNGQDESEFDFYLKSHVFSDVGYIYIADSLGIVTMSNDSSAVGIGIQQDLYGYLLEYGNTGHVCDSSTDGVHQSVVSILEVPDTGYYCIVQSYYTLSPDLEGYFVGILLPVLISLFVAIMLFVGFTGLTIRPLKEISKVVSRVSEGDYTARVDRRYTDYQDINSITVSSDLSDMAKTLNQMIETLENQEKDREIFISSIAHDIRTPLTSINGFITAMLDGTIKYEEQDKYLMMIKQEVDRIRRLIVSMTEASSLSHVDPELMENFDITEMMRDCIDNLEPQLNEKDITLEPRIPEEGEVICRGEAGQLCRVIVNVISNAVKFTPVGGRIIVTASGEKSSGKCVITVEDSGPGVEKEKRSRVFESFYKADPSRKQDGFGLGLYICKQILLGHEQTITLDESAELGGAKFVFSFPLRED